MDKLTRDEEEKLIVRSQQGDINAFNKLVLCHQQVVYNTVFRLLSDYDTASDVTQEAFISAFRAIRTYHGGSPFRTWLLRISTNLACDHWRRLQRHPLESLETVTNEEELNSPSLREVLVQTGPESNPEAILLTQEIQQLIQRGLQELSFDQRTVIVLRDIEGLSYEEIAQATQTTLGTVRSRLSRARTRLRLYLSQHKELLPRDYRPNSKRADRN
jgi:RNA polymerase sigma-70 factor (ECF subfamily)